MDSKKQYPLSPVALAFPDASPEADARLAASIAKYGQRVPVSVWNGEILDGRRRIAACAKPESTEGGRRVSVLKWPKGAPLNLG